MTKRPKQRQIERDDPHSGDEIVELPYKAVPDVEHKAVPMVAKPKDNIPVRQKENFPVNDREKAYSLKAPSDQPGNMDHVLGSVLGAKVEIELGRLVQASPELARVLRRAITRTRQPPPKRAASNVLLQQGVFPYMEYDLVEPKLEMDAIDIMECPLVTSFYIATEEDKGNDPKVNIGGIMASDPYMQYLADLEPDEAPRQVFVANESASLRVIFPRVNAMHEIEAVIDSGSQIVSMALAIAEELHLTWDPDIQIFMQSANGQLKKSAGLARNVPFVCGDITVYLQVHIIDQPAYKILLGRPFDILTESQIQNNANGTQTVMLKDPNTKKRVVLLTRARGTFTTPKREPSQSQTEPKAKGLPPSSLTS